MPWAPGIPYQEVVVDRPLVLNAGMTEVDAAEDVSSTPMDTLGDHVFAASVAHALGRFELGAEAAHLWSFHASFATHAIPEYVKVFAVTDSLQRDPSLHQAQGVELGHRVHAVPGLLAVVAIAGVSLSENRAAVDAANQPWERVYDAYATVRVEAQAARTVSLAAALSGNDPFRATGGQAFRGSLTADASATVTLGEWDLYADGGLADVTDSQLVFLTVGFAKRWGR